MEARRGDTLTQNTFGTWATASAVRSRGGVFSSMSLPPPDTEQHRAERRYKKILGIVRHNAPCRLTELRIIYAYSHDHRAHPPTPILRRAMDNGDVRRAKDGWVLAE